MPEGTPVHKRYEELLGQGYTKRAAAIKAQKETGLALATGKKPKHKAKAKHKR